MSGSDNPRSLDRPPALRPGDRVAVLTSSSPVPPEQLATGLQRLRDAGLEPVVFDSARDAGSLRPYLAGDDALRASELVRALADPTLAGVLFARGGSGAGRTLAAIDWTQVDASRPKVLAGYSDVTAMLEGVATKLGWASVHGANVTIDEEHAPFSAGSLLDLLLHPEDAQHCVFPDAVTVVPGRADGVTLGGNLSVVEASIGTDTSRPARGGILLLEELEEPPYRLDRMLTHLHRSGYLDGVAGIVCGRFADCGPDELVQSVLRERLAGFGVPMISNADVGHLGPNRSFPVGVAATLDADAGILDFVEPPLVP